MIVQNNAAENLDLTAFFTAEGVQLVDDSGGSGSSPDAQRDISVKAGETLTLAYLVSAAEEGAALNANKATLRFGAIAENFQDVVELELPVYPSGTPETVATAGELSEDGNRLEGIALPAEFDPNQGELRVNIEPSLAAGMREGLDYLEHYPHECTEQTVSRFLPNLVTHRAYQQLNLDNAALERRLSDLARSGLQRLYSQQNIDGGWGWCPRDQSNPNITAYVLLGLIEADKNGYTVDKTVRANAIDFLQKSLKRPKDVTEAWQANLQAFILYTLAEADHGDMGRTVTLFDQREQLDYYGRAFLALTFARLDAASPQLKPLLSDLSSGAIASATGAHWEERQRDFWAMNTNTRSTAIIIAALSRLDPENALLPQAVRWLMAGREADRWETTQETAWAIIGLTDWMLVKGELEGRYAWTVNLNGADVATGRVDPKTIDQTTELTVAVQDMLAAEINRLTVARAPLAGDLSSRGQLYYSVNLEYFKSVDNISALDRGIYVVRQYSLAPPPSLSSGDVGEARGTAQQVPTEAPISQAQVGDIINVKLTLIAPNDLYYVLVEDPFPAGTEGVDISLNTTSVVGEAPELTRSESPQNWGWWWFSHTELRDEKAVLFATYLPKGTYEYTYQIRATIPGTYHVMPPHAEEMYFPDVFGRGESHVFVVK